MRIKLFLAETTVLIMTFGMLGCGTQISDENRLGITPKPAVKASALIGDSFNVKATPKENPGLRVDNAKISISKAALDKEFLLQGMFTEQPKAPLGTSLKSRVVSFSKKGDKLFLLEATQGHSVTNEFPQNLILAQFSILEETPDQITFDFNAGMSNIFVYSDWHGQDFESGTYDPAVQFQSVRVRYSFIDSAIMSEQNQLVIRQVAQVVLPTPAQETNKLVEIKYYLSPYNPHLDFEPVLSKGFDRMGFFEVAPQLSSGGTSIVRASKHNLNRPIVYAVSANTPPEYKQAVKDGILYWNKAFGTKIFDVVDAPQGVVAPDANFNVIQWVDWDLAGFAYADAQMDPRSGEILHTQVFLTSVFAFGGKTKARALLRRLQLLNKEQSKSDKVIFLNGFFQPRICEMTGDERLEKSLAGLLSSDVDDTKIFKASQDLVREVAAHEIGHTLGLRHNFAGSLATNYSLEKREDIVRQYFEKGATPTGVVTTSSVMDYPLFEERIMSGDQVAKLPKSLSYDEKAIGVLYLKKKYDDQELPLYCTDTHVGKPQYTDCRRNDVGSSFVEYASWSAQNNLKLLPSVLFEMFVAAKAPDHDQDPVPLEKVQVPSASVLAMLALIDRSELLRNFTIDLGFLKIQRSFSVVSGVNEESVRKSEIEYMASEVDRLGGVSSLLGPISDKILDGLYATFVSLLERENSGIGYGGQTYQFTPQEIDTMKTTMAKLFKDLPKALVKTNLQVLSGAQGKFVDHDLGDKLAGLFKEQVVRYTLATTGEFIVAEIELPSDSGGGNKIVSVKLPIFQNDLDIRILGATLLKEGRGASSIWALYERSEAVLKLKKIIEDAIPAPFPSLKPEKMPKAVAKWIVENKQVLLALGSY